MTSNFKFQILNSKKIPFFCLAPMAGITTYPFASQCYDFGADILWTPMVHTDVIINNLEEALKVLDFENHPENCHSVLDTESKIPRLAGGQAAFAPRAVSDGLGVESTGMTLNKAPKYIVQLVGSCPEDFAKAVKTLEKRLNPLGYDINMGCPDKNIVKSGCGGALMNDIDLASDIIKAAKSATEKPISVKTRAGFDNTNTIYAIAEIVLELGVDMLTIHPRTVTQGYSGKADWEIIKKITSNLKPQASPLIVGSGDIKTWQDAYRMIEETGCDGAMIGRSALGNPWIFKEIKDKKDHQPTVDEVRRLVLDLSEKSYKIWGDKGIIESRKHYAWYFKGFPGAKDIRTKLMAALNLADVNKILK